MKRLKVFLLVAIAFAPVASIAWCGPGGGGPIPTSPRGGDTRAASWPGWGLLQSGISAAAGLIGVTIGGLITASNQKRDQKNARLREQLAGFYSPLLGIRDEIRAKSELRPKIHSAAEAAFQKQVSIHNGTVPKDVKAKFDAVLNYSNEQLEKDLVPLYRRMLEHHLSNMWLAEPSTLAFTYELVSFVEVWNRFYAGGFPTELLSEMEHTEKKLKPYYENLKVNFDLLRDKLK